MSWGVGRRRGSDLALLWLGCRLAAVAPIRPLAWKLPCASGAALKGHTHTHTHTHTRPRHPVAFFFFSFFFGHPQIYKLHTSSYFLACFTIICITSRFHSCQFTKLSGFCICLSAFQSVPHIKHTCLPACP